MVTLYLNFEAVSNLIVIGRSLDGSNALLLDLEIPCRCHGLVEEAFTNNSVSDKFRQFQRMQGLCNV